MSSLIRCGGPLVWPLKSCFRLSDGAVYECYFAWLFACLQSCRINGSSKGSDSQMWGEMLSWQKGLCSAVLWRVWCAAAAVSVPDFAAHAWHLSPASLSCSLYLWFPLSCWLWLTERQLACWKLIGWGM